MSWPTVALGGPDAGLIGSARRASVRPPSVFATYRSAETVQENPLVRDDFATILVDAVGEPG
jgi:hypothetical protein